MLDEQRLMRGNPAKILLILTALLLCLAPAAFAQAPTPTLDEINAVARELYCPLCNGVRLDTCELLACIQMRQVIADKLAAGVSEEQIKQEFVALYGPVVLGEPPRQGLDWLIWIAPALALVAGAAWLFYTLRRWTRQPAVATATASAGGRQGPQPQAAPIVGQDGDDYARRVEADLAQID